MKRSSFLSTTAALAGVSLFSYSEGEPVMASSGINIVLVHGVWSDGSGWARVIPILQAEGHNVVAVQNQMASLAADATNTRAAIDAMQGPTVVAGHSYGGAVMTSAAHGAANVKGLVFIAAFAPDEAEALGGFPPGAAAKFIGPGPGGLLYIDRAHFPSCFAGDLPLADGQTLASVQRPVAGAIFGDKMGPPAWKTIKSWYQVSEDDQMIPPDTERMMASRAKATTISLKSSHASLVSHPKDVGELIITAARS